VTVERCPGEGAVEESPSLAAARNESGVSAPLLALYHRKRRPPNSSCPEGALALDVFEAAAFGKTARLRYCSTEDPALVDAYATDGFFPGLAAFFAHEEAVRLLLARGASPNLAARNAMKVAAIHAASASGSLGIALSLIEAGADVNAVQQAGFTPLHAAAMTGQLDLANPCADGRRQ
jgi:hypothetical protein